MAAAQAGCSGQQSPTGPTVEIPTSGPVVTVNTAPSASADPLVPPKASATATPDDPNMIGYGVVDPMPPPASCTGLAQTIAAGAVWKKDKSDMVLELKLGRPGRADGQYVTTEKPSVYGAKLLSSKVSVDTVSLRLLPDANARSIQVSVAASCSQGPSHVAIFLDTSQPPKSGAPVATSASDSY